MKSKKRICLKTLMLALLVAPFFGATQARAFEITAVADPELAAVITGAGTYEAGATCTLTVTPNHSSFTFFFWSKDGDVVSENETFSFTVTEDAHYVANFAYDTYLISTLISPTEGGSVTVEGGMGGTNGFCHGQTATLIATPAEGYIFYKWMKNGATVSREPEFSFTVSESGDYTAYFAQGTIQTDPLILGWNWYSTYIEQSDLDGMAMLKEQLGSSANSVKSQTKYTNYNPYTNRWMGSLKSVENESTYQILTNRVWTIDMIGEVAVASEHPITLIPNWSWIGYPNAEPMSVDDAFASHIPMNGDQLKSQLTYTTYNNGRWRGSLKTIQPGMGLMYRSGRTTDVIFTYPEAGGSKGTEMEQNLTPENNHWQPNFAAYPDNMTVTAYVELDGIELRSERYELAAFANGECRGSIRLEYDDYADRHVAFLTVAGDEAAEIHFGLYDTERETECVNADISLVYASNAIVGSLEEPLAIRFRSNTGLGEQTDALNIYPNPVGRGERFSIGLPVGDNDKVEVDIFNALGAKHSSQTLSNNSLMATAPDMPGVYTLKITADGIPHYGKLVVK